MSLDILSFRALIQGSERVNAAVKLETAMTSQIAAQGDGKAMKELTKGWRDTIKSGSVALGDDQNEFLSKYGGGI